MDDMGKPGRLGQVGQEGHARQAEQVDEVGNALAMKGKWDKRTRPRPVV